MRMFDSARTLDLCTRLARPRLVGSEQEKKAREYCMKTFRQLEIPAVEQQFSFSKRASWLLQVVPGLYGAGLLSLSLLFREPSWIVIVVPALLLFCIVQATF